MAEVSAEARIEAPAEKVWSTITDFSVYADWSVTHTGFPKGVPADLAEGDTYAESMKLMGFPADVVWTVAELVEGRTFATTGKGPMGVKIKNRYTLTPDGEATTVRIDGEFSGGTVAMMAGKLKESATAAMNESLTKLNGLVA
ncbi:SRPBCC family protein [Streptomyces sp. A7024]|uniref:SRPBCC family protein n=1 Tax=Streptomyces coryli TaxID=1128680 RepID=A0A6G4TUE0_9ACTN|nr:SRPBCC family protein [Streptomyces coryli]NGN63639.1 SRPBCC family protein [Streptomyces coryli]